MSVSVLWFFILERVEGVGRGWQVRVCRLGKFYTGGQGMPSRELEERLKRL